MSLLLTMLSPLSIINLLPFLRAITSFLLPFLFLFFIHPSSFVCCVLGYSSDEAYSPREDSLQRERKLFPLQVYGDDSNSSGSEALAHSVIFFFLLTGEQNSGASSSKYTVSAETAGALRTCRKNISAISGI